MLSGEISLMTFLDKSKILSSFLTGSKKVLSMVEMLLRLKFKETMLDKVGKASDLEKKTILLFPQV